MWWVQLLNPTKIQDQSFIIPSDKGVNRKISRLIGESEEAWHDIPSRIVCYYLLHITIVFDCNFLPNYAHSVVKGVGINGLVKCLIIQNKLPSLA